jgi:hypothetical protein
MFKGQHRLLILIEAFCFSLTLWTVLLKKKEISGAERLSIVYLYGKISGSVWKLYTSDHWALYQNYYCFSAAFIVYTTVRTVTTIAKRAKSVKWLAVWWMIRICFLGGEEFSSSPVLYQLLGPFSLLVWLLFWVKQPELEASCSPLYNSEHNTATH